MQIKKVVCVFFLFATVGMSNVAFTADESSRDAELEELKRQIIEMQKLVKLRMLK